LETNKNEGVKAQKESSPKPAEETLEEEAEKIEVSEKTKAAPEAPETSETSEISEETTEEAKLEAPLEEEAVGEEETQELIGEEAEVGEIPEEKEALEEEELELEKREEIEEEIVEERIYTIPLRRAWISPRNKRAPRAVRLVKAFIQRHMKPDALVVSNEVNERLWSRGIQKPPRKIRVRAVRDKEGTVTLYLAEGD
jgi:large subunit ribosomal protein L31e